MATNVIAWQHTNCNAAAHAYLDLKPRISWPHLSLNYLPLFPHQSPVNENVSPDEQNCPQLGKQFQDDPTQHHWSSVDKLLRLALT